MAEIDIAIAKTTAHFAEARKIIFEYVAWLGLDLSFQNFDEEINNLESMYIHPDGGLVLASVNGKTAGIAGIRKFENGICELKRMFVKESFRKMGIGKRLMHETIELATRLNYESIKLDTADFMQDAIKLYQANGFVEIPAYRYNPHKSARFFELKVKGQKITHFKPNKFNI